MQNPSNICGIGLRHSHYKELVTSLPPISFIEIHTENFFSSDPKLHDILSIVSANYTLSFHSIGMSLGSTDDINIDYLRRLKKLIDTHKPAFVSDHLSWSSVDNVYLHDLLPLPYTLESFELLKNKVNFVQDYLGVQILIENPSSYISFEQSTMKETEFLNELALKTACGILLDVNNVYVSGKNLSYDPEDYLNEIDSKSVKQIHLAGFEEGAQKLLIDTHSKKPAKEVLDLFKYFIKKCGARPTIFEQDQNLGSLSSLLGIAAEINHIIMKCGY